MAHNQRFIEMEAYLDGELSADKVQAFEDALASDPEFKKELDARLEDRRIFREMLGEEIPAAKTVANSAPKVTRKSSSFWKTPYTRIGLALAASICLVILVPRVLRDDNGVEGPHSLITRSGQVAVVRYGEIPGETAILETGAMELPAGLSR